MIIIVNMSKLSRVLNLDAENNVITVEAGICGIELEEYANKHGFTIGHEPDSMEYSTVGGWIATNASGMKKNKYGNIEDIVLNYTLKTPTGTIELSYGHARTSSGVSLHKAFFGQEGNFGFISQATLKLFTLPKQKHYESIVLPDFSTGIHFLKDLNEEQLLPASIKTGR